MASVDRLLVDHQHQISRCARLDLDEVQTMFNDAVERVPLRGNVLRKEDDQTQKIRLMPRYRRMRSLPSRLN